jgi:hypothetical protein
MSLGRDEAGLTPDIAIAILSIRIVIAIAIRARLIHHGRGRRRNSPQFFSQVGSACIHIMKLKADAALAPIFSGTTAGEILVPACALAFAAALARRACAFVCAFASVTIRRGIGR